MNAFMVFLWSSLVLLWAWKPWAQWIVLVWMSQNVSFCARQKKITAYEFGMTWRWVKMIEFRWTIPSLSYSALLLISLLSRKNSWDITQVSFGNILSNVMQHLWIDLLIFRHFVPLSCIPEPRKCCFIFMCQCLMVCSLEKLNGKMLFHTATSTQSWADDTALHTLCLPLPISPEAVSLSKNPFGLTEQLACCCIVETDWRAIGRDIKERNAVTSHKKCDSVIPHQLALKGKLYLSD